MAEKTLAERVAEIAANASKRVTSEDVDDGMPDPDTREWIEARRGQARQKVFEGAIPRIFAEASLDDLSTDQHHDKISAWWESGSSTLLLVGDVGTGKTHAAYAVLRAAVQSGARAYGCTVFELMEAMRPDAPPSPAPRLATEADLYLFDDLASERATDWVVEQLGAIVDERTREGRRQVVTTNASARELGERLGPRIMSRLTGGATVCQFGGSDLRGVLW